MSDKKIILLFTENRKEEINIVNYFKVSDCQIKVAKEMTEFRHYVKNHLFAFAIIDSSVDKYSQEIQKALIAASLPHYFLSEESLTHPLFENVLTKPYAIKTLISMMEQIGNFKFNFDEQKVESYLNSSQYISVKIEDIINLKKSPYDYYVKINENKFVKVAKVGEPVANQTLNNILNKGVQLVYAKKEDYSKYLDMLTKTSLNINSLKVTKDVKMKFLAKTSELLMDQAFTEGLSKEILFSSKQVLDSSMALALEDDNMFNMLSLLNDLGQSTYRFSLAVSIYSVMIAKQLGWKTEGTIFKLSLGAVFSDIGLKAIDPEIVKRSGIWLNDEETKIYQQHPLLGVEIMRGSFVSDDILAIIAQHHENNDGTGYPRGLNKNNIHPLAKVVRVASEFCEQALVTESNPSPDKPEVILKRLYSSASRRLDLSQIDALAKAHGIVLNPSSTIAS